MYQDPIEMLAVPLDDVKSSVNFKIEPRGMVSVSLSLALRNNEEIRVVKESKRELARILNVPKVSDYDILKATQSRLVHRKRQVVLALAILQKQENFFKAIKANNKHLRSDLRDAIRMEACLVNMFNTCHKWDHPTAQSRWELDNFIDTSQESTWSTMKRYMTATQNDWKILLWYLFQQPKPSGVIQVNSNTGSQSVFPYLTIESQDELSKQWFLKFGASTCMEARMAGWKIPLTTPKHAVFWCGPFAQWIVRELPTLTRRIPPEILSAFTS